MKIFLIALILLTGLACKRKLSHSEVENQLKMTMHAFLINRPDYDSNKLRYDVLKVNYFEDKSFYECEFEVHLKVGNHDTTGIMTARVSKDFSRVSRKL
jgi:hypothetical protein